MSSRHHIDDFMRGRIIGKIEEGRKITDVAREFDIAHSVVSRLWKSFKTPGMCSRRHGGGRVRSTTPAEDIYIVLSAKRNRRTTAQQVANQFLAASGKQISRKTVARRLRLYINVTLRSKMKTVGDGSRSVELLSRDATCELALYFSKFHTRSVCVTDGSKLTDELVVNADHELMIMTIPVHDHDRFDTIQVIYKLVGQFPTKRLLVMDFFTRNHEYINIMMSPDEIEDTQGPIPGSPVTVTEPPFPPRSFLSRSRFDPFNLERA
ncbi:transposable element Tcb2 transposase [Trichonephila clavipes]|nr:transposable element Tcb2 transposase [Trichonephila clavipes]